MTDADNGNREDGEKKKDDPAREGAHDGDEGKENPSPFKNPKVRIGLIVLGVVVVVGGAFWFFNYWTRGRFRQNTNDAYLQADQVTIAPKISGYVEKVFVEDNQEVRPGDPLVQIDPRDTRARMEQAQAQVDQGTAATAAAEAQLRQQEAQVSVAVAQLEGARQTAVHAQAQADRYGPLTEQGAQSAEQLEQMMQARDQAVSQTATARAQLESARRQADTLRAQIGTARAQTEQAQAQLRQAETDLDAAVVRSSIGGRVGDRAVRVGQFVQPGARLMSVVPVDRMYLVANFKETQIGLMRAGQPAEITVDALSGSTLHGTVQSFAPGTGAQFALLPPQNATGNFTKIVQRVPVRIGIDAGPEARRVLVPGLSVDVTVDTIGARDEHRDAKRESSRDSDHREAAHDSQVAHDRDTRQQGGAGR